MNKESLKLLLKAKFSKMYIEKNYGRLLRMMPEEYPEVVKKLFHEMTGLELDLNNPKRFTEKIQWRKLNDHSIAYSLLSDKYRVREWVANKIGADYLIPLLGVWQKPQDIDFNELPSSYVLKTNNGCATNIIVKNNFEICERDIVNQLDLWLKEPFWARYGFELQYKDIKPCIICEKYMHPDEGKTDLTDYKFYCFDGEPRYCQIINNRSSCESIDFFDMNWVHMDFIGMNPNANNSETIIEKPRCFDELFRIVSVLCEGFSFVRVDIYVIQDEIFFGEMTFTPGGGFGRFNPDEWDYILGNMWDLNQEQVNEKLVRLDLIM